MLSFADEAPRNVVFSLVAPPRFDLRTGADLDLTRLGNRAGGVEVAAVCRFNIPVLVIPPVPFRIRVPAELLASIAPPLLTPGCRADRARPLNHIAALVRVSRPLRQCAAAAGAVVRSTTPPLKVIAPVRPIPVGPTATVDLDRAPVGEGAQMSVVALLLAV